MDMRFVIVLAVSLLILSAMSAAQDNLDGTGDGDDGTSDDTVATTNYSLMTLEELVVHYNHHIEQAERILALIELPPEDRPELTYKTLSELFMMYEYHAAVADEIYSYIILLEPGTDQDDSTEPDDNGSTDDLPDSGSDLDSGVTDDTTTDSAADNDTYAYSDAVSTDNTSYNGTTDTTDDGDGMTNDTDDTNTDEYDYDLSVNTTRNGTVFINGSVPVVSKEPIVTGTEDSKERLDDAREKMMEFREEYWMRYRNYTEYRESLGQKYENTSINRSGNEVRKTIMIGQVRPGNAVRVDVAVRDEAPAYTKMDAVYSAPPDKEDVPVTFIDISVINEVDSMEINIRKARGETNEDVYDYLEIEKSNVNDEDINDIGIGFTVAKSWIDEREKSSDEVVLFRMVDDEWTELPTRILSEDAENVYYESQSAGFSYFAIGITAAAISPVVIDIPDPAEGAGLGDDDEIVSIKFSWELVLLIITIILVFIVLLKYAYISKRVRDLVHKENEEDLRKLLEEYSAQKSAALNQYYKREITNDQMNQIVNGIKKKEFDVQMRIKKLQNKGQPQASQASTPAASGSVQ